MFDWKIFKWLEERSWIPECLKESNRIKHFILGIPAGFIGTILFVLGLAAGMEYKDEIFRKTWDWKDFGFTCLGGMIGQIFQLIIILLILFL